MCKTAEPKPQRVEEPDAPPEPLKAEADPGSSEGDEPGYGHGV